MLFIILGDQITRPQCLLSYSEPNKKKKSRNHNNTVLGKTKRALATVFDQKYQVLQYYTEQ